MDVDREALKKTTFEDEIRLELMRKKDKNPIHQMGGFLITRERQGDQSLKTLIIIQHV